MSGLKDSILNANSVLTYVIVTCLVFAEDAIFVGSSFPERLPQYWAESSPAAGI